MSEKQETMELALSGFALLSTPRWNKGTAFPQEERDAFDLQGLLPAGQAELKEQIEQAQRGFEAQPDAFAKYIFLRDLQDTNETLFYAFLLRDVAKYQPIVYTPTVGEACQHYSEIWRRPRGLFVSYPERERMEEMLARPEYDKVRCIVVSDGERILGLGNQGAGGMGIPVGKLSLYTALAGVHPEQTLPILLDVGTDNEEKRNNPLYIGWRHGRVRGEEYDSFVQAFVEAVKKRWPHVLLQWEDFAGSNAARLLGRYRDELCTFNDDIQGTAGVVLGTILSALQVTGGKLPEQRIVFVGFGSAGIGIADLFVAALKRQGVDENEARKQVYAVGSHGLLVDGDEHVHEAQKKYARDKDEVKDWGKGDEGAVELTEVIRRVKPSILIGATGKPGTFPEDAVREMAKGTERPVILPLSNPTDKSEAKPEEIMQWTDGKALIGTGSPFDPVDVQGRKVQIDQVNNSYVFPGVALGVISARAQRVSDEVFLEAAQALAGQSPAREDKEATLLPDLKDSRKISRVIAEAVGRQVLKEGVAGVKDEEEMLRELEGNVWEPVYVGYRRV